MAKQLDHKEVAYGVRFAWYDYPNSEGDKRFESPRRVQHVNTFGDRGLMPFMNPDKDGVLWSLYKAKDFINRFMNCGLPEKLMSASEFELVKMMVMTDKISIDSDGQLAVSWHDLDLYVEVVKFNDNQAPGAWKHKTMARWEVLAKSANEPYFPAEEMNPKVERSAMELFLSIPAAIGSPFVCPMAFRDAIAQMLNRNMGNVNLKGGEAIDCFGVIVQANVAVVRVVPMSNGGFDKGAIVELRGEVFNTLMRHALVGDGASSEELKRFWTEKDDAKALSEYVTWFKNRYPELR